MNGGLVPSSACEYTTAEASSLMLPISILFPIAVITFPIGAAVTVALLNVTKLLVKALPIPSVEAWSLVITSAFWNVPTILPRTSTCPALPALLISRTSAIAPEVTPVTLDPIIIVFIAVMVPSPPKASVIGSESWNAVPLSAVMVRLPLVPESV